MTVSEGPPDASRRSLVQVVSITKSLINNLEFPATVDGRITYWDAQLKGFGIRVYPSGAIAYVLQYRMKGRAAKTQTLTIGKHGSP